MVPAVPSDGSGVERGEAAGLGATPLLTAPAPLCHVPGAAGGGTRSGPRHAVSPVSPAPGCDAPSAPSNPSSGGCCAALPQPAHPYTCPLPKSPSCCPRVRQRQPTGHSPVWGASNTPPVPHVPAWLWGRCRASWHPPLAQERLAGGSAAAGGAESGREPLAGCVAPCRVAPCCVAPCRRLGLTCRRCSEPGSPGWPAAGRRPRSARPRTRPAGATLPPSASPPAAPSVGSANLGVREAGGRSPTRGRWPRGTAHRAPGGGAGRHRGAAGGDVHHHRHHRAAGGPGAAPHLHQQHKGAGFGQAIGDIGEGVPIQPKAPVLVACARWSAQCHG